MLADVLYACSLDIFWELNDEVKKSLSLDSTKESKGKFEWTPCQINFSVLSTSLYTAYI